MDAITETAAAVERPESLVRSVVRLLDDGNTVPFLVRYRADQIGNIDAGTLREMEHHYAVFTAVRYVQQLCAHRSSSLAVPREG